MKLGVIIFYLFIIISLIGLGITHKKDIDKRVARCTSEGISIINCEYYVGGY